MKVESLPGVLPIGNMSWSKMDEWKENQEYELIITPRILEHLSKHPNLKPGSVEQKWPDGQNEYLKKTWMITGRGMFNTEYEHVKRSRNMPEELNYLPEALGLDHYYFNFNKQEPGACSPMHVDTMSEYYVDKFKDEIAFEDQTQLGRILVAVDDWEPGHFWAVGDLMWKDYKAGDMVYADVWNVMHGTGNASFNPRHTLLLDGIYTPEVVELLTNNTVNIDLDAKSIEVTPR